MRDLTARIPGASRGPSCSRLRRGRVGSGRCRDCGIYCSRLLAAA